MNRSSWLLACVRFQAKENEEMVGGLLVVVVVVQWRWL
jgi:hypothetical protein